MSDKKTIDVYDARAGEYADLVEQTKMPGLDAFIAAMPKGAHVLDLGCGPGNSAVHMAAAGCVVTAVDASAEMVALAKAQPGVNAHQARFDQIEGTALYDGIWASFSLLHAPKSAFPGHLSALHQAAKPGARLHLSVKTGEGEFEDSIGRFYAYYTIEELDTYLTKAGFRLANHLTGEDRGLSGDISPWVAVEAYA
ncbi:class I SAM-dependent methyltransferase [Cognatishimia sp. MH4019]|uniref:class I SAM-dependent DNA methyltransferase n=1 Tax=Cognatishimia sp. MH4019 TaxID=2854030 RepID=UPI001CD75A7B|nr:class I SAM-dependent methyltransferase [Cognatishimia sp. MH4019]